MFKEYTKNRSSIGSTRAARTDKNFAFDYYITPKPSWVQQLKHVWGRRA